eukprot:TRINITY_DN9430_c0_g1_i1.p1 TRINITY_DN9430_c0_g1~~TRINITY_DN9430_c0_g1_i1.p1  ORF type:complete len:312 (-),score=83.78 TRINITY_DN9430_c0_g1_i1:103-1038(-)
MESNSVVIASRKSELAMIQTNYVKQQLEMQFNQIDFTVTKIDTKGDKILDVALSKIGDKGLFTWELEQGILSGEYTLAVHSLKDLPTSLPDGLCVGGIGARENPNDVALIRDDLPYGSLKDLPEGSVVGSSSLRRVAQLKRLYPQLEFKDIRGNLNTRLAKLNNTDNGYSAIILAAAGIIRMGWEDKITEHLDILYAPGQGALAIECKEDNTEVIDMIQTIFNDQESKTRCIAERSFLARLEGGCHVPIGVRSIIDDDTLSLEGIILSLDGSEAINDSITGSTSNAREIGLELAERMLKAGGMDILNKISQ